MSTLSYTVHENEGISYEPLGPWIVPKERTFGMIKPEGIARNLVDEIEKRITAAGLEITNKKRLTLSVGQYDVLYGHVRIKSPRIYEPMKAYLTSNPSIIMIVSGTDAVERLLEVRGSSDPNDALPGTIRGDFARDQGYQKMYEINRPSLNVFHAADSIEEAKRDLKEFFGIDAE
jgi:nucleoside-diphosphate kinase